MLSKNNQNCIVIKVVKELSNENLLNRLNLFLIDSFLKLVGGNKGHVYFKEKILYSTINSVSRGMMGVGNSHPRLGQRHFINIHFPFLLCELLVFFLLAH